MLEIVSHRPQLPTYSPPIVDEQEEKQQEQIVEVVASKTAPSPWNLFAKKAISTDEKVSEVAIEAFTYLVMMTMTKLNEEKLLLNAADMKISQCHSKALLAKQQEVYEKLFKQEDAFSILQTLKTGTIYGTVISMTAFISFVIATGGTAAIFTAALAVSGTARGLMEAATSYQKMQTEQMRGEISSFDHQRFFENQVLKSILSDNQAVNKEMRSYWNMISNFLQQQANFRME